MVAGEGQRGSGKMGGACMCIESDRLLMHMLKLGV